MNSWNFDAAYAANSRMVYWAAYGIVKSESDAMDVSQDTFLRALRHEKKLAAMDERQQKAWFYRVAVNLCYDKKRKEKREFPTEDTAYFDEPVTDEATLPELAALSGEQKAILKNAIDNLPEAYRETVTLHYYSELPYEEIAALMGVSEGTVKSRMFRAKEKLYNILRKDGEQNG